MATLHADYNMEDLPPTSQPCAWQPGCDHHEQVRLDALLDLEILDSWGDEKLDRITRLAAQLFRVPMAAVSLTDADRQFLKSSVGFERHEFPRHETPCSEVTRQGEPIVIRDLAASERFGDALLARAGVRFYAGVPLTTHDGFVIGSLCVLDRSVRETTDDEMQALEDLAAMAMDHIERKGNFDSCELVSGLPDRMQLMEDLASARSRDECGEQVAVVIDLADPGEMNKMLSVLGTVYLDDVVRAGKAAVREIIGPECKLYLVKTMSFLALLDPSRGVNWLTVVTRLQTRLKAPILCGGVPVNVSAMIGISPFNIETTAPRDVIRMAVSAACEARERELAMPSIVRHGME